MSTITKHEIKKLLSLRAQAKTLSDQLEVIKAAEAELDAAVTRKLDSGAANRSGFDLCVQQTERRYPKWKEVFISRVTELGGYGATEADAVLKATEPTVRRTVIVESVQVQRKAAA